MQAKKATLVAALAAAASIATGQRTKTAHTLSNSGPICRSVSFEGEVKAGEAFRREFTPGLELFVEPLRSGWIIRVLAVKNGHELREPHDYAEVATPPFRSVSPLLISTDWAFRAQDAAAWNPRTFRYATDGASFARLGSDMDHILAGDAAAEQDLAMIVTKQPEAALRLLDVVMAPGTRDQGRMAAAVASHLDQTPLEVLQGAPASPLGYLQKIRFRVRIDLPPADRPAQGLHVQQDSCMLRPTA